MRRLLALALLLLAPADAAAQPTRVDLSTRGVAPTAAAAANSAVIQAALDEAAGRPVELYFPPDRRQYPLATPIDPDFGNVTFSSSGTGATLILPGRTDPVFVLGFGRRPGGRALTPDHLVDAFGRLDASAARAPGQRWGYRTRANSWIAQGSGPWAMGPWPGRWPAVRRLTAEVVLDTTDAGPAAGPLWNVPGVACGYVEPNTGRWGLWLAGPEDAPGHQPTHRFTWPVPRAPGVHRVAVQVDLDAPRVTAYADGDQVAVAESWAPVPGGGKPTLAADAGRPYLIGAVGDMAVGVNYWPGDRPCDLLYLGHAIYSGLRYADDGAGSPQRRLDGAALADASRCFAESDPDLIALLRLRDPPESAGSRLLTTVAGPKLDGIGAARGSSALIMSPELDRLGLGPFAVRHINVVGRGNDVYGAAILVGNAQNVTLADGSFRGGAHGIGCWGAGANYLHRGRNLTLAGSTDAAFVAVGALWDLQDVAVPVLGRNTFHLTRTRLRLRGLFAGDASPILERLVYGDEADVAIADANVDIENGRGPTRCLVELKTDGSEGGKTIFGRFEDLTLGGLPPNVPLFILGKAQKTDFPGRFDLRGVRLVNDNLEAFVRVESPGWAGTVDVDYAGRTPAIRDLTGGRARVVRSGPLAAPAPVPATMPDVPR